MDPKVEFDHWVLNRSKIFKNRKNPPTDICKVNIIITADLSTLKDRHVGTAISRVSEDFREDLMDQLESLLPSLVDEYVSKHSNQNLQRYKIDCRIELPKGIKEL